MTQSEFANNLLEHAEKLLNLASKGESLEIYLSKESTTHIRVYNKEVEQLTKATDLGAAIRLIKNKRQAFCYIQSLNPEDFEKAINSLREYINYSDEDPFIQLNDETNLNGSYFDGVYSDSIEKTALSQKVLKAKELEQLIFSCDPKIKKVEHADYDDEITEISIVNTNGVAKSLLKTRCFLSGSAIAEDNDDHYISYVSEFAKDFDSLNTQSIAKEIAQKAISHLNAIKPKTAVLPVVFSPRVSSIFLSQLTTAFSAEALYKNMSFFKNRLQEQVAAPLVSIVEDPTDKLAYGATYFDGEASQVKPIDLIKDGILMNFLSDLKHALATNNAPTASAVRYGYSSPIAVGARALKISSSGLTFSEILKDLGTAILIDSVIGTHSGVNPVSGDFSVGAEGFEIKNGELGQPLKELTVASSLQKMLLDITHISDEHYYLPSSAQGRYIAFKSMAISGL
jgi:PmbA protein